MSIITPEYIVTKMMSEDRFSQWLGIEILEVTAGSCKIKMVVRPEMVNGFGISHGGIVYSFADTALAFACNSAGRHAVSTHTTIHHQKSILIGDTLIAQTTCRSLSHKLGHYSAQVTNQNNEEVAFFSGTVYRKSQEWRLD